MCALRLTSAENLSLFQKTSNQNVRKLGLTGSLKRWLWLNSIGGRLFWAIMLGSLTGLGGMAFLFSEMLKRQAEDQMLSSIDSKVNAISSVTESAETLASSLGISAVTLNERKAQYPDTYRELVLQLFEQRPEFVVGLGLGQSKKGIIENQSWLFPYYSAVRPTETTALAKETIDYKNFASKKYGFYPESERYKKYFLPQERIWTDPYSEGNTRRLTYYYPLFDKNDRWLGTTLVDIDTTYLGELLDDKVFQKTGNFLLLTRSGLLIADPTNPLTKIQSYKNVAGINSIWNQIDTEKSGFLPGKNGYWAYSPIPGKDWLLFGFVPYKAVLGQIVKTTALVMTLVGLLIATVIYLAIRRLNQRIKPILLQANQFVDNDEQLMASLTHHDQLEQVSFSFFNMLNQINLHQEVIHRQEESIVQKNLHINQVTEIFLAFTMQIDEDASKQQMLLKKLQQQLANQVNEYQSVNSQLNESFTLVQILEGFLESIPSAAEETQLFNSFNQHILALTGVLDHASSADKTQYQLLITQLITDIATLKAYIRQQHILEKLQHKTSDLSKDQQATIVKFKTMVSTTQNSSQILTKIDALTNTVKLDAKQVSTKLWENLQQVALNIPEAVHNNSSKEI